MRITYYITKDGGKLRYWKENRDNHGNPIARLEVSRWEYERWKT